jgi:hypothetical protein
VKKDKSTDFNSEALKVAAAAGQLSADQKVRAGLDSDTPKGREALEAAAKAGRIEMGR